MTAGCWHERTGLRFYPTWPGDILLSEAWNKGDTSLARDLLGIDEEVRSRLPVFGAPPKVVYNDADFPVFTVIVKGRLPREALLVSAVYVNDSGDREPALIEPRSIAFDGNQDWWVDERGRVRKEPGYYAFIVTRLTPDGGSVLPMVVPGRYRISLESDGVELCGSDLTIRDPDDTYHGSGLLHVKIAAMPVGGERVRTVLCTFTATATDARQVDTLSEPIKLNAVLHGGEADSAFVFARDEETQTHTMYVTAPSGMYLDGTYWLELVWEDGHGDHVVRTEVAWCRKGKIARHGYKER